MSLSAALHAAGTGLALSSRRAEITASNIANASTPGYARRSLSALELNAGGETSGVRAGAASRNHDAGLAAQHRDLQSDAARAGASGEAWKALSSAIGDTAAGEGLFAAFDRFGTALDAHAASPESSPLAHAAAEAGASLAGALRGAADKVLAVQSRAEAAIRSGVAEANAALHRIAELNGAIQAAADGTESELALQDERGRQLDLVAGQIGIETQIGMNGAVEVRTREGVPLVLTQVYELAFDASEALISGAAVPGPLGRLAAGGIDITPGPAGASGPQGAASGALSAQFETRDLNAPRAAGQLDALAADLVARLSEPGLDPSSPPGAAGLFHDPLGQGLATEGLASRIVFNAAADPAQGGDPARLRDGLGGTASTGPGDGSLLERLASALSAPEGGALPGLPGQRGAKEAAAELASFTGRARVSAEAAGAAKSAQLGVVALEMDRLSGVDIDAEMSGLLEIERAYAANARVLEVAASLLDRLLEI